MIELSVEESMSYMRRRISCFSITLAALSISISSTAAAFAHNTVGDFVKYFNPLPQKNYLNESQDRRITKGKFKAADSTSVATAQNPEQGIFAILPPDKFTQAELADRLLSDQRVAGLSVLVPWKTFEPTEEKYNWADLDALLALCQKHNKTVILRVSTCGVDLPADGAKDKIASDTPEWVFANGAKSVKYNDKNKTAHLMPVFWDQTYLAAFSNFIGELGSRYDKNILMQSVGITGGGFSGGTSILPTSLESKNVAKDENNETGFNSAEALDNYLRKDHALTQKKIVDHWKYVADIFPQAFPNTRLNFAINPTTPNRAGEDALDEISDYLVFRYGEHIYITRQNIEDGRHSFDDYRVQLKFRADTYAGVELAPSFSPVDLSRLSKAALDDGISFVEIPVELLDNQDATVKQSLEKLAHHLGYHLVSQTAKIPAELMQGDQLKADFSFLNIGDTSPKRPVRELDKDVASSYKVMIELKDSSGKMVAKILHTPSKKTELWKSGENISWQQSLKMPELAPGEYEASASIYDPNSDKKLNIIDARETGKQVAGVDLALGKLRIVAPSSASKTLSN